MSLTVATWNINSVRLRQGLVLDMLARFQPDVLCLQETKCPVDQFPGAAFAKAGYVHQAVVGQKGYNGCAILSRLPFAATDARDMCEKGDARHVSAILGKEAGKAAGIAIHNFYVPAGGDIADREQNPKFGHKLDFLTDLDRWAGGARPTRDAAILVGDLNIAPYEHDVWSHKQLLDVVSHTPVETEALEGFRVSHGWVDAVRHLRPEPEKVYSWWSYRAQDWRVGNRGRRLDHVWLSPNLAPQLTSTHIEVEARGWERPSDHVPVLATLAW